MKNKNSFAFLIHPPELKDVAKKYPFARFLPDFFLKKILKILPPLIGSQITGFKLPSGEEMKGWIVICPLTAQQMLDYPELAQRRVLQTVRLAERLGCRLIGLGAFSSIVTDGGIYLLDKVRIGLTTGNAYAAALIIENLLKATKKIEIELRNSILAILGAAGSVGSACSKILAPKVKKIILIDKREEELKDLVETLMDEKESSRDMEYYLDLPEPIRADIIVTVASASEGILKLPHIIPGTIIIDAAQPSNVSEEVAKNRKDIIVINSGIVHLKDIHLNMDIGLNKEEIYACLGEVLILLWRGWPGHYSLGKVNPKHVEELLEMAPKMGLSVAAFRNRVGIINDEAFERIKKIRNYSI